MRDEEAGQTHTVQMAKMLIMWSKSWDVLLAAKLDIGHEPLEMGRPRSPPRIVESQ